MSAQPATENTASPKPSPNPQDRKPDEKVTAPAREIPQITCARCKTKNPTGADRCQQCNANLLPGVGAGRRVLILLVFLGLAAWLAYQMYDKFIRAGAPNPESFWLNPISLGVGILFSIIAAFVLAFRRTPMYARYENRALRHRNIDPWQSIEDYTRAIELAYEDARPRLIKQRAICFENLGQTQDAARDRLTLAVSPKAWKEEAEFLGLFIDMNSDVFVKGMRDAQIAEILKSGMGIAVGYCPECKTAVDLNTEQACLKHPKIKGRNVQYVIPIDRLAGRLTVLQTQEALQRKLLPELSQLLEEEQAVAIGTCPKCKDIIELTAQRQCPRHPKARISGIEYLLPQRMDARQRELRRDRYWKNSLSRRRLMVFTSMAILLVLTYFLILR
jgi:ribosomal protein L40E